MDEQFHTHGEAQMCEPRCPAYIPPADQPDEIEWGILMRNGQRIYAINEEEARRMSAMFLNATVQCRTKWKDA